MVMVRPDHFGFNAQTASTNPFQHTPQAIHKSGKEIRDAALEESATMIRTLRANGIDVLVIPSRSDVITPDAIFPNNWFSHHHDGKLVLYPMLTPIRRLERQKDALVELLRQAGIKKPEIIDLTHDEEKGMVLEATGSMILDRVHKVAFAMASARTVQEEFEKWCESMGYEGLYIHTPVHHLKDVYHTNMDMCVGSEFVVVCLEVIGDKKEKKKLLQKIKDLGKECIEISLEQVYLFCGNILELVSKDGEKIILMSETAHRTFTGDQIKRLEQYGRIVAVDIALIEEVGGGGVRCMVAEVFPPGN